MFLNFFLVFNVLISITYQIDTPPPPRYRGSNISKEDKEKVAKILESWTPCDKQSAWELSGLYEGDILLRRGIGRNGLRDKRYRWPNATLPYFIENSFTDKERDLIKRGMMEIEDNSCVTFRPYKRGDRDYVYVQNNEATCWSSVGRIRGAQQLNLGRACFRVGTGTVVHEFLHALGFFHEHSTFNRDDYVEIHRENIEPNKTHNFQKLNSSYITNFRVGYDYGSLMHYGRYAFTKNKRPTITPKQEGARIGQTVKMSEKDIRKLKLMYDCGRSTSYKSIKNVLLNATNVKEDKENDNTHNQEKDKENDNPTNLDDD